MSSGAYSVSVRGCDLSAYDVDGTAYVLLQCVKDAFYRNISYSSFLRRKNKVVSVEQPVPSHVVEQCRKSGILPANTHRASGIKLSQLDSLFSKAPPTSQDIEQVAPMDTTSFEKVSTDMDTTSFETVSTDMDTTSFETVSTDMDTTSFETDMDTTSFEPETDTTDREAGCATDQVVDQAATSTQTEAGLAVELAPSPTAKKTKILLSPSDNEKLLSDMQELRQYYTESISLHRSGNVLAPSTLQTMERRILSKLRHACIFVHVDVIKYSGIRIAFLGFVKLQKPDLPVDLRAVLNLSALKEFLNFMKASYISLCTIYVSLRIYKLYRL